MKEKIKSLLATFITVAMFAITLSGCFGGDGKPKNYTLQYTDDEGTHQITVTDGEPYSLENVPQRTGYEFLGLFDAETGGKQYVSAQGASLSVYEDKKNTVLFPQWKAKQYNLILDFQGAEVTSSRSFTVDYGSSLPQLPIDLQLEHKEFCGWYTKENCGGTQIADKFGLLPVVSVVNGDNFDLSQDNARINLYAGFTTATYSVTLDFGSGLGTETLKVPYGTDVKNIIYNTRTASGEAVLSWSRTAGDTNNLFTGTIVQNTTLYAVEWAPAIEFDCAGGERIAPVVARAGAAITLPVPARNLYKFLQWEDRNGYASNLTVMPSSNVTLKAVWQAKIVFDSNGGESVNDISEKSGVLITLPSPEREGYIFAGWYTADKQLYTSQKMPSSGTLLKAGWYREKTKLKTFLSGSSESAVIWHKTPNLYSSFNIDFTEECSEIDWMKTVNVIIDFHANIKHGRDSKYAPEPYYTKEHFYFYSQPNISDAYIMEHIIVDHGNGSLNESYVTCNFTAKLPVSGGKIYTALGSDKDAKTWNAAANFYTGWRMTNFWAEIHYPDTSNLYL